MIRPARMADVTAMHEIITTFAKSHQLLPVSLFEMYQGIRESFVCETDGRVVGTGSLRFYWKDLAEVRSLAVAEEYQGKGYGSALLAACEKLATEYSLERVFTLTYRPEFFEQAGYARIEKSELPQKIWADCVKCHEFPSCSETALIKGIT